MLVSLMSQYLCSWSTRIRPQRVYCSSAVLIIVGMPVLGGITMKQHAQSLRPIMHSSLKTALSNPSMSAGPAQKHRNRSLRAQSTYCAGDGPPKRSLRNSGSPALETGVRSRIHQALASHDPLGCWSGRLRPRGRSGVLHGHVLPVQLDRGCTIERRLIGH